MTYSLWICWYLIISFLFQLKLVVINPSQKEQTTVEIDLKALEVRVEELIRACDFLKKENHDLKVNQESLVAERTPLVEKTELAKTRIEAMISRLKSLDT